jgi:hypothetical protein
MSEWEDKLARLPKWARDEINDRGREINRLRDEVVAFQGKNPKGRIFYQVSMNEPVYIPEEARVFFRVGEMAEQRHKSDEIEIDLDSNQKMLNVRSSFGGVGVLPQAENAVILFPQSKCDIDRGGPWAVPAGNEKPGERKG